MRILTGATQSDNSTILCCARATPLYRNTPCWRLFRLCTTLPLPRTRGYHLGRFRQGCTLACLLPLWALLHTTSSTPPTGGWGCGASTNICLLSCCLPRLPWQRHLPPAELRGLLAAPSPLTLLKYHVNRHLPGSFSTLLLHPSSVSSYLSSMVGMACGLVLKHGRTNIWESGISFCSLSS